MFSANLTFVKEWQKKETIRHLSVCQNGKQQTCRKVAKKVRFDTIWNVGLCSWLYIWNTVTHYDLSKHIKEAAIFYGHFFCCLHPGQESWSVWKGNAVRACKRLEAAAGKPPSIELWLYWAVLDQNVFIRLVWSICRNKSNLEPVTGLEDWFSHRLSIQPPWALCHFTKKNEWTILCLDVQSW